VVDCMLCVRPQARVCSIVCYAFDRTAFDREVCDRSQIIALKSHGASVEVMAARATRDIRLMRNALDRALYVQAQCARSH
jgi:hypothetical protein